MLDILQLIKLVSIDVAMDTALDRGYKVIEHARQVIFTKDAENMSVYFTDDDKSSILRVYL